MTASFMKRTPIASQNPRFKYPRWATSKWLPHSQYTKLASRPNNESSPITLCATTTTSKNCVWADIKNRFLGPSPFLVLKKSKELVPYLYPCFSKLKCSRDGLCGPWFFTSSFMKTMCVTLIITASWKATSIRPCLLLHHSHFPLESCNCVENV
jgi:hypothetical protein